MKYSRVCIYVLVESKDLSQQRPVAEPGNLMAKSPNNYDQLTHILNNSWKHDYHESQNKLVLKRQISIDDSAYAVHCNIC